MKRAPSKRDLPRQTLAVSVNTVSACMNAAHPTAGLSGEPLSLTFQGELSRARKNKRAIVIIVRKRDMSLGGQIYTQRGVLNAWINLPSARFLEILILAMSGGLSKIELTTEKLRRDSGEIFGIRFATGQVQSTHERNGPFK
jgi:hypothetical protein